MRFTARLTGVVLAALAVLHLAWGLGSAFPFRTRGELADAVVGSSLVPPPMACFAVAGALATGTALVANVIPIPPPIRRLSLLGMAAVFGFRATLGLTGKTALVSPGSDSERFIRLDRRIYAPTCLGLSVGSVVSIGRTFAERQRSSSRRSRAARHLPVSSVVVPSIVERCSGPRWPLGSSGGFAC
jgi:hypothetical protein